MTGTAALIAGRQREKIILIALLDIIQNKRGVLIELQIVDDRDNWSVHSYSGEPLPTFWSWGPLLYVKFGEKIQNMYLLSKS